MMISPERFEELKEILSVGGVQSISIRDQHQPCPACGWNNPTHAKTCQLGKALKEKADEK